MTDIRSAAEAIAAARRGRTPLAPLPADAAPATEAEGYRIQDAVHDLLAADIGARVGYKIGCTSAVMQQYLEHPASLRRRRVRQGRSRQRRVADGEGFRPRRRRMRNRGAARARSCGRPRHRSPPSGSPRRSTPIIRRSRSSTTAMSNGRPWARRRWSRMISSPPAACSAKAVPRSAAPDLLEVVGRAARSTATRSGRAPAPTCSAIPTTRSPGSPTISPPAAKGLRAGEIVLTGSLVKTVWLNAGDSVVMKLAGLGNVSATFS